MNAAASLGITLADPTLQKLASGEADPRVRRAAARGALPLSPADSLRAFYVLSRDPDKEIRLVLKQTIDEYDEAMFASMAAAQELEAPVLHFLAAACLRRPRVLEEVVLNPHTADATILFLAQRGDGDLLELISVNEERLHASRQIVDVMMVNPNLQPRVRLRLQEILVRHFGERLAEESLQHLQKQAEEQERREEAEALAAPPPPEAMAVLKEIKASMQPEGMEGEAEVAQEELSLFQRVSKMNTGRKIMAAMTGDRSTRTLLIRDTNAIVQRAVLKSPKITTTEVELVAQMRNVREEILAMVAAKKEWIKNYTIMSTLVKNPRTPMHLALNLVGNLNNRDLVLLTRDRNVTEAVRRQARVIILRKEEGQKKLKLKKK
jgi:hypothetical protein